MARSENNLKAVLQDTADAIRAKDGSSAKICPRDFADRVNAIPTGPEPTGEIEISEPFTKVNVADKEFAYTNNDTVFLIPSDNTGEYCYLKIKASFDDNNDPLYCTPQNGAISIQRVYDPTDPEYSNPYNFNGGGTTYSYYVENVDHIRPKYGDNPFVDNRHASPSVSIPKRLCLVLACIYNSHLAPADINVELHISITIRLHHPNMTFEEAIAAFGEYIDIVDLTGQYIKKGVPIGDIVYQWIDNDSSGSTSINSDEYSY